jgi:3-oxoacyl-(acyl-carrier-protein) synthase
MIAGGFDNISEEGSYKFVNTKATSIAETDFALGREPTEMSHPATASHGGFMEAQGTSVHIVMGAKTALELGAPIWRSYFHVHVDVSILSVNSCSILIDFDPL